MVGIIVTGLILVTQSAQYDGCGTYCVLDTNVWSGGRDADTFRGGGCYKACSSTPKSRLKRSMISGGVSERVQSRSDLALVVSSFLISPISLAYVAATVQLVPSQFSQLGWMSRV